MKTMKASSGRLVSAYDLNDSAGIIDSYYLDARFSSSLSTLIGWMSKAGGRLYDGLICPIDGSRYRERAGGGLEHLA